MKCQYSYRAYEGSNVGCRNETIVRINKSLHCRHPIKQHKCCKFIPQGRTAKWLISFIRQIKRFVKSVKNAVKLVWDFGQDGAILTGSSVHVATLGTILRRMYFVKILILLIFQESPAAITYEVEADFTYFSGLASSIAFSISSPRPQYNLQISICTVNYYYMIGS